MTGPGPSGLLPGLVCRLDSRPARASLMGSRAADGPSSCPALHQQDTTTADRKAIKTQDRWMQSNIHEAARKGEKKTQTSRKGKRSVCHADHPKHNLENQSECVRVLVCIEVQKATTLGPSPHCPDEALSICTCTPWVQ